MMIRNYKIQANSVLIYVFSILLMNGLKNPVFAQENIKQKIDRIASEFLSENNNHALIIGINNHGKEEIFYYGETEKGKKLLPDQSHIFEIGQLTQLFTSILYADMTVKGIVRADDELRKFLPVDVPSPVYEKIICSPVSRELVVPVGEHSYSKYEYTDFVCKPDPEFKPQPILLCYLSTHTSGLPDRPSNLKAKSDDPYAGYTKEKLYEFLKSYTIPERIGYDFHYSNLGLVLLGHAMELRTKIPYEQLIADSICKKLEMTETTVNLNEIQKGKLLQGYNKSNQPVSHWTFDVMAPCAGLHSTITDMMKFLAANLGTVKTPLKDVLDYTHNPRILFHNKQYGEASIGLSWMISPLQTDGRNYVWLEGLTGGFSSFIGFDEIDLKGVVILSNCASPVSEMGKKIIQEIE